MVTATELIVLHSTKFSESSLVVHTLSREYGRRSFIVKGIGKTGRSMSLFLPLNILSAEIVENPRSSLYLAKNFSSDIPLCGIRGDILKNTVTLFISEVLFKTLKEGSSEPGLYDWCRKKILLLDAMEADYSNFHLRFLTELCGQLGFAPEADNLVPFAGEYAGEIRDILELPFPDAMMVPLSGKSRGAIAEKLIRYLEFHNEAAVNINSLKVLGEVFR